MVKKYAPKFYKVFWIIFWILIAIGILCFFLGMVEDEGFSIIGLICIAVAIMLLLDLYFASLFFTMAVDKGYTESTYLIIAYIFTFVGYLLIIAMPDKNAFNRQHSSSNDFKASLERIANLKAQGILTEDDAAKMRAEVLNNI